MLGLIPKENCYSQDNAHVMNAHLIKLMVTEKVEYVYWLRLNYGNKYRQADKVTFKWMCLQLTPISTFQILIIVKFNAGDLFSIWLISAVEISKRKRYRVS